MLVSLSSAPVGSSASRMSGLLTSARAMATRCIWPPDISLEAAELLEVFQWSGADISNEGKQEKIREELADVVNYCVLMADACGLDLDEIVREKIKVNAKKYPVEKAKGKSAKYDKL